MKKELHLMIIWKNALYKKKEILEDLAKSFTIRNKFLVNWSDKNYSSNLSRFYGTSLPDNSFKEEHCGRGEFLLIVFEDKNPIYDYRNTSHGKEIVNTNVFDKKSLYRDLTGGGHKIHATDNTDEFNHDITLLLGLNRKDFIKKYKPLTTGGGVRINQDLIGADGWKDLNEMFYVLNNTNDYVVLRDFENDLSEYPQDDKDSNPSVDIDILSNNSTDAMWILNITPASDKIYQTKINGNKVVYFDIKDVKDGYYCSAMSKDILKNKEMMSFYYIPNSNYHYYSCLYHALIHKFNFDTEYNERLEYVFGKKIHNSKNSKEYYIDKCSRWLLENNYTIDLYSNNLNKFNEENIKLFDRKLNVKEVIYKHKLLLDSYNEVVKKLELQIERLNQDNIKLSNELTNLYNSRSWKVTRPLRGIRRITKRSKEKVET